MSELWRRERFVVGGGRAHVALIALSAAKLPDPLPVSRSRHGMPSGSEGVEAVELTARDRAADPEWFATAVVAPFADMIAQDLGAEAAAIALAADHAVVIEVELEDPDDLGHLQAAWAIAKCVCEEGAAIVVDVFAARAHLGAAIAELAPDRAFDVMHEVTLFFEDAARVGVDAAAGAAPGTLVAWTLGLGKVGRPELVLLGVSADDPSGGALALRDLAALLADGDILDAGDTVGTLTASTCDHPALAALVDGRALVLRS